MLASHILTSRGCVSVPGPKLIGNLKEMKVDYIIQLPKSPWGVEVSIRLAIVNALLNRPSGETH